MVLFKLAEGTNTAAVFTKNKYCAAPVIVARQHLSKTPPRALLINAGNANAGTGQIGLDNARQSCQATAKVFGLEAEQVLPFSTGVIGEQLPMDKVLNGINTASTSLSKNNWLTAAAAIMTTDTLAKGVSECVRIGNQEVTITGIAKGSGMICPDMATLLSYVATDADISVDKLQNFLELGANASFNRITVDSDTSTNDALVLVATGKSGVIVDDENTVKFSQALEKVLVALATSVVRDGEGATKFVKIEVLNGVSEVDCESIAYSVAHSPLVKTALFASDPNWGRILAAVGKADVEQLDIDKINIQINGQPLIESGQPAATYTEEIGQSIFQQAEITISIDLALGDQHYHVWTSDLSHEYVSINADYRS
ncbi:UNVERIFIED_CONTAM: hypothetical protein GTU68_044560 [Idotea baltica]|nr:hypothetical protein [Idotea baltica]